MTNILVFLVIILVIVTSVQLIRVSELLSELKNRDVNEITDQDNNTQGLLYLLVGAGFLFFVIWQMVNWNHLLLPDAASLHGEKIDGLMKFTMGLILAVFFITSPMLFYFAYKYKYQESRKAQFYPENNKLELIWTIIPAIVLTILIGWGLIVWAEITGPPP